MTVTIESQTLLWTRSIKCAIVLTIAQFSSLSIMKPPMPKLSVLLDRVTFDLFERFCAERGLKKSTFIAKLVRDHLRQEGFANQMDLLIRAKENHQTTP